MSPIRLCLWIGWIGLATALPNGLARTPPMGWNTWFALGCSEAMNATSVKAEAALLKSTGLQALGYSYVNLDDCWVQPGAGGRDPASHKLQPDADRFGGEAGLQALAGGLHADGFLFGVYTDRGSETCEHRVGSRHFEAIDAQTFASWGVDFVKEDSCGAFQNPDKAIPEYILMRDALNATGRPVFFSLCGWHDWYAPPMPSLNYTGGASLGNSARIASDDNSWPGVLVAADVMSRLAPYARPGYWNDPDMLLSVDWNGRMRMSELQSRAQFSLWWHLGRLHTMSQYTLDTYSSKAAIAINQLGGVQGTRLEGSGLAGCVGTPAANCTNVWGKVTSSSSWAVMLLNAASQPVSVGCDRSCLVALGLSEALLPLEVFDVWNGSSTLLTDLALQPVMLPADGGHKLLTLSTKPRM